METVVVGKQVQTSEEQGKFLGFYFPKHIGNSVGIQQRILFYHLKVVGYDRGHIFVANKAFHTVRGVLFVI